MTRIKTTVRKHEWANRLEECGYTREEAGEIYDKQLQEIIDHTREYLDSIQYMSTYRVPWKDYRRKTPVLPLKHVDRKQCL